MKKFLISLFSGVLLGSIISFIFREEPLFFRIQGAPHYVENSTWEINLNVFPGYLALIVVIILLTYGSLYLVDLRRG